MLNKRTKNNRNQIQMVCIEDLVPQDHLLRKIENAMDFEFIYESLISKVDPNETEMQFFRQYSAEIEVKRERVSQLINQLKELI